MNYCLYKNGTMIKTPADYKLLEQLNKCEYAMIDISTSLKGPLYTIVKAETIHSIVPSEYAIKLDISYSGIDCPVDDSMQIKNEIFITSLSRQFCIYPLITELYKFNSFKDDFCLTESTINIDEISFEHKGTFWKVNPDDVQLKDIKNIFKNTHIYTNGKVLKDKYLLLDYAGYWKIISELPVGDFAELYFPVTPQAFYKLSYKEYFAFNSIKHLSIQIFDSNASENAELLNYDELDPYQDIPPYNILEASNLKDILYIMLYYPQYVDLENKIYNRCPSIRISIDTNKRHINLIISNKEASHGFCLFEIIKNLLSM